jgi:hypothetical protein
VKRGDLPRVTPGGTVVIIDGEFDQNLSVSPKEILALLDLDTVVVGASSMGAIRAVELNRFGMLGLGWVFEAYRSGRVSADDEVAVMFSPDDYTPVTVPLINVRCWLTRLRQSRVITRIEERHAFRAAKSIFFADRTKSALNTALAQCFGRSRLETLLGTQHGITDVKREDAEMALRYVSGLT